MHLNRRTLLSASAGLTAAAGLTHLGPTPVGFAETPAPNWQSDLVKTRGPRVVYPRRNGLRLPDWGYVGYRRGAEPPQLPVVTTIAPVAGDNTAHLQAAIDAVGARPVGADGTRGALLLEAGRYDVAGTVYLRHSGVVLRGVGDGADPASNTVLFATGNTPEQRDVLVVGGGTEWWNGDVRDWQDEVPGTRTDVTSDRVPLAATSLTVAEADNLAVGDNVVIVHPCSQAWLDAVDGGGTGRDPSWGEGSFPITFNRYISELDGDRITLDAPIFYQLDRSLSQSYLYVWTRSGLVTDVGVESLRIDIETSGDPEDEDHAWNAIRLIDVEDAWVRGCTVLHFGLSGVATYKATRVTITDCRALDPVSRITGSRRYNFNAYRSSQQILITGCYANRARHAYVSNGTSTVSGVVFHRCTAEGSLTSSEGHRCWSQGLLFDNHTEIDPDPGSSEIVLALINRGDGGTSHGWGAVHSVAWRADVADAVLSVMEPPTGQNYAIGCLGTVNGKRYSFTDPNATVGYIEGTNRAGLEPESLYEAQAAAALIGS